MRTFSPIVNEWIRNHRRNEGENLWCRVEKKYYLMGRWRTLTSCTIPSVLHTNRSIFINEVFQRNDSVGQIINVFTASTTESHWLCKDAGETFRLATVWLICSCMRKNARLLTSGQKPEVHFFLVVQNQKSPEPLPFSSCCHSIVLKKTVSLVESFPSAKTKLILTTWKVIFLSSTTSWRCLGYQHCIQVRSSSSKLKLSGD